MVYLDCGVRSVKMSDRRRYEYLINALGALVLRPGDGSVWSTTGHYYHESAVRELVKALRSDHAEHTKGNFNTYPVHHKLY